MAYFFKRNSIWYVRYKDVSGKWVKKSCGKNANKADADYLVKEYSSKELNYHHKAPVRMINTGLKDALIDFRDRILLRGDNGEQKEISSVKREQAVVNTYISFLEEEKLSVFKQIDKEVIQNFMDKRATKGIAQKTKREERRVLRKFFIWAVEQHYCNDNPAEKIVVPKIQKKNPRYFSEDELIKIFSEAKEPYRDIFKFLYLTGLRIGELSNLERRDFDKKQRTLTIRVMSGNKTKREESIPLSKEAIKILMKRHKANKGSNYIFLNGDGSKLDNDNIYRNLKRILNKTGIKDVSPHTFRHTFASHLVIKGVTIYTVKELLRHKSVKETEVYAHLSKDAVRKVVEFLTCGKA